MTTKPRPYLQPKHLVIPPDARERVAETADRLADIIGPARVLAVIRGWILLVAFIIVVGYVLGVAWLIGEVDIDQWHEPYIVALGLTPVVLHIWQSIRAVSWAWSIRLTDDVDGQGDEP